MARLNPEQIKRRMEKSLTKDKILKRKVEKQKQKEIYEEKWYKDETKRRMEELEEVAPVEQIENKGEKEVRAKNALPSFFDSFDINCLFNPIKLIRNKDEKVLKIKLENYKANEKLFEPLLIGIENEANLQDDLLEFYSKIFSENEDYKRLTEQRKQVSKRLREARLGRIEREELKRKFNLNIEDLNKLNIEREDKELEKIVAEYEAQGFVREDLDLILDKEIPTIGNKEIWEKLGEFRTNFFSKVSNFFQRFIPIYDKYTCTCCGKAKELTEYYVYYNLVNISRIDYQGNVRLSICKDCSEKLFNYLYLEESGKSIEVATKKWCAYLNIYYDEKIVIQALRNFNVNEHKFHFIKEYLDLIYLDEKNIEKTFLDSNFLFSAFESSIKNSTSTEDGDTIEKALKDGEPVLWKREDVRNRKQVIKMLGYDPFDFETEENKIILYNDLLNMLEAGMENDIVKVQAAIQIVLSYFRIRQLNKQEFEMRKNEASLTDLKALAELKTKELNTITKFSQDNGFSERFATAKAKGENTFTGILKKMDDDHWEDAMVNKYDIETSVCIQQAAQASIEAIFRQLNMSDSDAWKTCQNQLAELIKLRKENEMFAEQLRLMKIEIKRLELTELAKSQGISIDDDNGIENDEEDEE